MRRLLKLAFREKKLFRASLLTLLISAVFTLAQMGVFTEFAGLLARMGQRPAATTTVSSPRSTLLEKASFVWDRYREGGMRSAMESALREESGFLLGAFGAATLALVVLMQASTYAKELAVNLLGVRVAGSLRLAFFEKAMSLPSSWHRRQRSGDLLSKSLADIHQIQQDFGGVIETLFFAPIMIVVGFTMLLRIQPEFTLILIVAAALAAVVIQMVTVLLRKAVSRVQGRLSDLARHLADSLYAIDVIKIFGAEKRETARYEKAIGEWRKQMNGEQALVKAIRPLTELLGALAVVGIVLYGAMRIWAGAMALDDLLRFMVVLVLMAPWIQRFASALATRQRFHAMLSRLDEVLKEGPERTDGEILTEPLRGAIRFERVSFTYQGANRKALSDLSFEVKPGEFIAVVGPSGSGKSTLLHLIPGLFLADSGRILLDDRDLSSLRLGDVRRHMAWVGQETLLIPGSLKDNIRFGREDADDAAVDLAARAARLEEVVAGRPEGWDAPVGERGVLLSGGQRQRVAIARALLREPSLLLLDEATAALDAETEKAVQLALETQRGRRTILVVAHRLATVKSADRVLVLEDGRLLESGSPDELKKAGGLFARLWDLQFNPGGDAHGKREKPSRIPASPAARASRSSEKKAKPAAKKGRKS